MAGRISRNAVSRHLYEGPAKMLANVRLRPSVCGEEEG